MSFLARILETKRAEVLAAKARVPEAALLAADRRERRDFLGALRRPGLNVIAEIKRASPSKGLLAPDLDAAELARSYEKGGAAAISVLTDREFFRGSLDDLAAVRRAAALPLLRKDFTIEPYQVIEAAAAGADAVLLIAACLDDPALRELHAAAEELDLAVLVEVRDERELERAAALPARIIGVNNRDLSSFRVDLATGLRLLPLMPREAVRVAESGIKGPSDAAKLYNAGADAILVGESLVKSGDAVLILEELREGGRCSSRSAV